MKIHNIINYKLIMYYLQNKIINLSQKLLFKLNQNNEINGIIVFILHCLIIGFFVLNSIFGKVDHIYILGILILLCVVFFHLLFRGCILIKLERRLLNSKDWYGPWTFLFRYLDDNKIKYDKSFIYNITAFIIGFLIILKMIKFIT